MTPPRRLGERGQMTTPRIYHKLGIPVAVAATIANNVSPQRETVLVASVILAVALVFAHTLWARRRGGPA